MNGPIWIDLQGLTIAPAERAMIQHPNTGGVLLFTRNYANKTQLKDLVNSIRDCNPDLLLAVDHEGGRIWRFNEGFTRPASAQYFGELFLSDPEQALLQIRESGRIIAAELVECGIDISFAPVLDLDHGISTVIRERSYGRDPKVVIACARAFIAGFKSQGMQAVGKHFPGHGGCSMDSHFTYAVDARDFAELAADDMQPFVALHKDLAGIMPAHVAYPNIDQHIPAISKFWLAEVLRQQIGFTGAIISDCFSMEGSGFATNMARGAQVALEAGCDMIIATRQVGKYIDAQEYLRQVLDKINWQVSAEQKQRIQSLAANFSVTATA